MSIREMFIRFAGTVLAAAIAMMSAGCSVSDPEVPTAECRFTVAVEPEILVRGDLSTPQPILATRCVMELYYEGQSVGQFVTPLVSGQAHFAVQVVAGRSYDIAFWADKQGCYDAASLKNVTIATDSYDCSDNSMDAYSAVCNGVVVNQDDAVQNVTLTRCLAKVTISNATGQTITLSAPASYNVLEDTMGATDTFTYTNPFFYLFAPASKSSIDVTIGTKACTNVPIQRNYITNIIINH